MDVKAGEFATIGDIATGTECVVTEATPTNPPTGWSYSTPTFDPDDGTVTVEEKAQTVTVTVKNELTRDKGSLKIVKELTDNGAPVDPDTEYKIGYKCGDDAQKFVDVKAGEFATIGDIATGTECVVTEATPTNPPTGWSYSTPTFDPADGTVTVEEKAQTVTVTVKNELTRDKGSLKIVKELTDNGAPVDPDTEYKIGYKCGDDAQKFVDVKAGEFATIGDIATGTECVVTEATPTNPPTGWSYSTPTFDPDDGTVTVEEKAQTVTVTVKNELTRDKGSLKIVKELTDNGAPVDPDTEYKIGYKCGDDAQKFVDVKAGEFATIGDIATGTECVVTEATPTNPPTGWSYSTPTFDPDRRHGHCRGEGPDRHRHGQERTDPRQGQPPKVAKVFEKPAALDLPVTSSRSSTNVRTVSKHVLTFDGAAGPNGQVKTVENVPTGDCTITECH